MTIFNTAYLAENKYQFYSLWFDQIGVRTRDLPHLNGAS